MIRGQHGGQSIPGTGAIIGSVFVAIFGVFWTILAVAGGTGFFALFGVGFVILAIGQAVSAADKSAGYSRAQAAYQARRRRLIGEIGRG